MKSKMIVGGIATKSTKIIELAPICNVNYSIILITKNVDSRLSGHFWLVSRKSTYTNYVDCLLHFSSDKENHSI